MATIGILFPKKHKKKLSYYVNKDVMPCWHADKVFHYWATQYTGIIVIIELIISRLINCGYNYIVLEHEAFEQ